MNNSSNNTILNHLEKKTNNNNNNNNKRSLENPKSQLLLGDTKDFKEKEKYIKEKYPNLKANKESKESKAVKVLKESIFSVKNICVTLKPMINNIIQTIDRNSVKIRNRRINGSFCSPNSSSILKEKYINELVNEFEESRSKSRGSSKLSSKRDSIIFPNNSNLFNKLSKSNNNDNEKEEKPKRTLKEMFSKAFNFNQTPTNNNNNIKDVSNSRLAKMLQDNNEDSNDVKKNKTSNNIMNNNINNKSNNDNNIKQTPNTVITDKNKNEIIVELMNKIDKDISANHDISIRKAKLNNDSFIDLNDDDENENENENENLNIGNNKDNKYINNKNKNNISKISIKEENKKIMNDFVFNVIIDNTGDDYECKTFFIQNKNDNINNNNNKNINNDNINNKNNPNSNKEKEKDSKLNKSKDSTGNKIIK
jgi:hypothetical protein